MLSRNGRTHRLPPSPLRLPIIGHLHLFGPIPHRTFHKLSTIYGFRKRFEDAHAKYDRMIEKIIKEHEEARKSSKDEMGGYASGDHEVKDILHILLDMSEDDDAEMRVSRENIKAFIMTRLFVNIWAIGRDPKHWENPLEFNPDRFIGSGLSMLDMRGQHFQLIPFGSGMRGCPGTTLASQVVQTALATVIQCFNLKIGDGANMKVDMIEVAGATLTRAHPPISCRNVSGDISRNACRRGTRVESYVPPTPSKTYKEVSLSKTTVDREVSKQPKYILLGFNQMHAKVADGQRGDRTSGSVAVQRELMAGDVDAGEGLDGRQRRGSSDAGSGIARQRRRRGGSDERVGSAAAATR
ncbi:hypothetical protein Scep_003588 [Stephania cephalantha]|uniref:Cytochrome P450 n=1 Tax=Stephania cephalantha TaxID=152367 RepID=A0AAP0PWG7_9MAGN